MPLCLSVTGAAEGRARVLEFSTRSQSDFHDVIADAGFRPSVLAAAGNALREIGTEADVIRLAHLPEGFPATDWVVSHLRGYLARRTHAVLALESDYAKVEGRWRSSHRRDIRRQRKRLEAEGAVSLSVLADGDDVDAVLAGFFDTHRRKWASTGDERVAHDPVWPLLPAFYARLWTLLSGTGLVHFSVLRLDGRPVSYHFGFIHNRRFYFYKPAYDPDYENLSPGKVHVAMLIAAGCDASWDVFDFLLGDESYKYAWTSEKNFVLSVVSKGGRTSWAPLRAWWLGRGMMLARDLRARLRGKR
jgi:CelD/BcsL family acetyltransferase involved in cellulose biosynthesis